MAAAAAPPKRTPVAECDKILCKPGTPFELETVEIAGRPTTVWKNVSGLQAVVEVEQQKKKHDHLLSSITASTDANN